jgi:hypothetical protein
MNDAYTLALFDVVKETSITHGYDLPEPIEAYVVMLLASYVDKTDFLPETFAESFLTIKTTTEAKELGDTCLFVAGVFPTMGTRKGLSRRYYQDIGSTSYEMASDMNSDLFPVLSRHFNFLSSFIEVTVNTSKHSQSNLFR